MTSKISFFNLCAEDMKRRIWTIVLSVLTFFISMPLASLLILQNMDRYSEFEDMRQRYTELAFNYLGFGPSSVITGFGAVICGIFGFSWLFSKTKVDLYHAVPVRREKLFCVSYVNGILIYLVPYFISIIVCFLIFGGYTSISGSLIGTAFSAMAFNLVFFLLIYNTCILAVMLTGNMINCMITCGVLFFYTMAFRGIIFGYMSVYFDTFYQAGDLLESWKLTSPILSFIYGCDMWVGRIDSEIYTLGPELCLYLLKCLVIAAAIGGLALCLYKIRPSEAAGKSIAFVKIQSIYRIILVIPLSMGSALLFMALSNGYSFGWALFGLIFGLVLSHGLIEVLFQMDIRGILSYKRQLLVTGVISFLISMAFRMDVFGYDKYIPRQDNIASMSVVMNYLDEDVYYSESNPLKRTYIASYEYKLMHMELTDLDAPYKVASVGVEIEKGNRKFSNEVKRYLFRVKYNLKNGKEIIRNYWIPYEEVSEEIAEIYSSSEYKDGVYYMLSDSPDNQADIWNCHIYDINGDGQELKKESIEEFLAIYKEELYSLSLEEVRQTIPVAEVSLDGGYALTDSENMKVYGRGYPIYASFEKTLAFLKEQGINQDMMIDRFDPDQVDRIRIRYYGTVFRSGNSAYSEGNEVTFTGQEAKELAGQLQPAEFGRNRFNISEDYYEFDIYADWTDENGESYSTYAFFMEGVPKNIKDEIGIE